MTGMALDTPCKTSLETAPTWQDVGPMEEPVLAPRPPIPAQRPTVLTKHGDTRVDPFYWLRQRANPEVVAYLKDENEYTDAVMAPTSALQEKLYEEIVSRVQQTDMSPPVFFKGYWHYSRTVEGLDYEIYCRRKGSMEAPEEIELDLNELARDHDYFELGYVERSPNENLIGYAVDLAGNELHQLHFRDLASGQDLPDVVDGVYYGSAWSADSRTFFYVRPDKTTRPYQAWRHALGTSTAEDVLVLEEGDERFELSVEMTKSERYIIFTASSQVTSESRCLRSDMPDSEPMLIEARRHGIEYSVDHQGDRFLILTNDGARNFRLMAAPVD